MMFKYFNNCVGWSPSDVEKPGGLVDLIDARVTITRRTFLSHVNRQELSRLAENLTYASHPKRGLTMAADWHIEYFRSKHHGKTVYGFRHSAIEYVFKQ